MEELVYDLVGFRSVPLCMCGRWGVFSWLPGAMSRPWEGWGELSEWMAGDRAAGRQRECVQRGGYMIDCGQRLGISAFTFDAYTRLRRQVVTIYLSATKDLLGTYSMLRNSTI